MEKEKIKKFIHKIIKSYILSKYSYLTLDKIEIDDRYPDFIIFFALFLSSDEEISSNEQLELEAQVARIFELSSLNYIFRTSEVKLTPNSVSLYFKQPGDKTYTSWTGNEVNPQD